MEEIEDQDSPRQLSTQSQSPLDPNTILEEALTTASSQSSVSRSGNNKKVNVLISEYMSY
jgi:hypothetical protein